MKKEFVNYNQALALKELGFDEDCLMYIDDEEDLINDDTAEWIGAVKAPIKQQVFRWFREKHNLLSWIFTPFGVGNGYFHEIVNLSEAVIEGGFRSGQSAQYTTYKEAELSCIDELIEIVKNK